MRQGHRWTPEFGKAVTALEKLEELRSQAQQAFAEVMSGRLKEAFAKSQKVVEDEEGDCCLWRLAGQQCPVPLGQQGIGHIGGCLPPYADHPSFWLDAETRAPRFMVLHQYDFHAALFRGLHLSLEPLGLQWWASAGISWWNPGSTIALVIEREKEKGARP